MLKIGLLTSTAMTAVALLLFAAPHEAQAQTAMHIADRDANTRFMCTYANLDVYFKAIHQSGSANFYSQHVAVPVTGQGQKVSRIIVMESRPSGQASGARFSAGIYSNGPSGFPGKRIAGGKGAASSTCGQVTIKIPSTMLKANTKYWIEEKMSQGNDPSSEKVTNFFWDGSPKLKNRGYVQTAHGCIPSSYCVTNSSTWTKQSIGPWFKLK